MQEFKIGDWVQVIAGHERPIGSLFKVKSCLTRYRAADVKLWTPKEGEWCWFCSVNGNSELGQFIEEFFEGRYRYKLNGTNSVFNCDAIRCEPFIGKLPTFLKDK